MNKVHQKTATKRNIILFLINTAENERKNKPIFIKTILTLTELCDDPFLTAC